MMVAVYIGMLHSAEQTLADAFRTVADGHTDEPDVHFLCHTLADQCQAHVDALTPAVRRYGEQRSDDEPERLKAQGLSGVRSGPLGLLRDLQDLYILANFVDITWTLLYQAASALRDRDLLAVIARCEKQTGTQLDWLRTRLKQAAPQALVAAD
jgi:hypothetical protein